jgi:hypothetical protein
MAQIRFNHMELTVAPGTLDDTMRADLRAFYGDVLGWETMDVEIVGGRQFLMRPDDGQFILVAEHRKPLSAPGYDHLGFLCDTAAEVDEILDACKAFQSKDERLRIKEYEDLVTGTVVVHAFYLKYLLPIWFDVQSITRQDGSTPSPRWHYA